ncbi:quinoprotein relay system zinc metallohydrolase 2 [Methylibium sp.]|uniref:quinoprotein relay system zinc metallohydrolase 2 n=1 Tax=Methylibium sp. TaxID=2067992 RepID=UPI003D0F7322
MRQPVRFRSVLRTGLYGALALLTAACAGPAAAPTTPPATIAQIAPGVYLHRGALEDWGPANQGDVSNSGFVVGSRCVAVIDTGGSAPVGQRLLAAVRHTTSLPVCYVINTHAHPDHVLGNSAFADAARQAGEPAPQFVGHRRLPAALATRGPFYLNALKRDFGPTYADGARIVPPTVLVDDRLELELGERRLSLRVWPTAHTDADLSVLDERSRTLFLGDLLFVDHTPVVDGRLKGWLAALARLRGWQVATVVPGHGAPSPDWPAALDAEQAYLARLQADVRAAIKQGLTLSQAVARIAPDRPDWRLLEIFHARNVTAAYAELEWED